MAVSMASLSQLFLAHVVEPRPGTTKGSFHFDVLFRADGRSVVTFSKVAFVASAFAAIGADGRAHDGEVGTGPVGYILLRPGGSGCQRVGIASTSAPRRRI